MVWRVELLPLYPPGYSSIRFIFRSGSFALDDRLWFVSDYMNTFSANTSRVYLDTILSTAIQLVSPKPDERITWEIVRGIPSWCRVPSNLS